MAAKNECMRLVATHKSCMPESMPGNHPQWKADHCAAWCLSVAAPTGTNPKRTAESALVHLITGLAQLCDAHRAQFDSEIGDAGYSGDYATDIAKSLLALLNCERGRLDGGTLNGLILDIGKAAHLDLEY